MEGERVGVVAEMVDPGRVPREMVEAVAVDHEQPPAVDRDVHELVGEFHVAEGVWREPAQKFVVVARHVKHPRAALEHAEDPADHVARGVGPDEVALQLPAVHDVAHEIEAIGLEAAEKVEQILRAGKPAAKMHVGDEEGANSQGITSLSWERCYPRHRSRAAPETVRFA